MKETRAVVWLLLLLLVVGVVALLAFLYSSDKAGVNINARRESASAGELVTSASPPATAASSSLERNGDVERERSSSPIADKTDALAVIKLYKDLDRDQRMAFLKNRARHVSLLLGGEPYEFGNEIIELLARDVEQYRLRVGNRQTMIWGDDLNYLFARAQCYSAEIIRAFRRHNVPVAVGLYIVAVETEFRNIRSENFAGAAGLFQFIPGTAELYGVSPRERTNVRKMADAAARYMSNRISEFGTDSTSVELAIAGYNRSPDSVRRDLQEVLSLVGTDKARSFWNLIAHSTVLDRHFRGENVKYVPKFMAIAIIGETPWAFDLQMKQALSSCVLCDSQCKY
jgi:hypothetical protein